MREVFLRLVAIACGGAVVADDCTPLHVPADLRTAPIEGIVGRSLDAASYRVGRIAVVRQDVFATDDPAEDNAAYRLANRWHIVTREDVVRDLLLFRSDDTVTPATIAETERALRAKAYLYDARVVANRVCRVDADGGGQEAVIEVIVVTRDVWSLAPELSVTRTGGEDRLRAGVTEINLGGRGSHLDLTVFENLDRQGVSVSYADPNLARSRIGVRLRYDDTDDGELVEAGIGQPFYALSARRSWNAYVLRSNSVQGLYRGGDRIVSFRRDYRLAQVSSGFSRGRQDGWVNRLVAGITLEDWRHAPVLTRESGFAPRSRRFVYPWVSLHRIEDEYAQLRNVDRVQTAEDVHLGRRYDLQLGYAPDGDGHFVATVEFRDGSRRGDAGIFRYGARTSGYWSRARGQPENAVARVWARYRHRQAARWALILDGEATATDGLTDDQQVLIGGGSGLRGYPNRYQAGTRAFRFTAEERFYTDLYPLRILRIALAGFVDVGAAWESQGDAETLANVGVGLRFESTRTDRSLVYHLDVAFPVVDGPGVGGVEVTLTSKRGL